jgi:hypothetical protein
VAQDPFAQYAVAQPQSGADPFAAFAVPETAETPGRVSRLISGTGQGLKDTAAMFDPRNWPEMFTGMGRGFLDAAKAGSEMFFEYPNPEKRVAQLRGFRKGVVEANTGVSEEEAQADPWTATGKVIGGVVIPALTVKGTTSGLARFRAPRVPAPRPTPVTGSCTPTPATIRAVPAGNQFSMTVQETPAPTPTARLRAAQPQTFEQVAMEALEELRQPTRPNVVELPPPTAQPPVSYPRQPSTRTTQRQAPAERPTASAEPPKASPDAPETPAAPAALPASWQRLVDAEAPEPPRARFRAADDAPPPGMGNDPPLWARPEATENPAASLRGMLGAEDASAMLGVDADTVRNLSGAARRRPLVADMAEIDNDYLRRINDPRGFIDPKLAIKMGLPIGGAAVGGAMANDGAEGPGAILGALLGLAAANPSATMRGVESLRMTGMLSGAALPKSVAGNVGAVLTAAAEQGSTAPIREALRVPTNLRNAARGWQGGSNPAGITGMSRINIPGRAMGALDEMTTQALQRAGLSLEDAQRLLLTRPNPLGAKAAEAMNTPIGRMVFPFQRTPFNAGLEGLREMNALLPGSGASATRRGLTAGAMGAGAVAGSETDHPLVLAILAALMGPRAAPFALGVGATGGKQLAERVGAGFPEGSWGDMVDPLRPITNPALLRLLETGGR